MTTREDWNYRAFGPGDAHFGSSVRSVVIKETLKDGTDGKTVVENERPRLPSLKGKAELIKAISLDAGLNEADARRAWDASIGTTPNH